MLRDRSWWIDTLPGETGKVQSSISCQSGIVPAIHPPGVAVLGWRRKGRARWAAVAIAEVLRHPDLLEPGQRVVLACELPPEAF